MAAGLLGLGLAHGKPVETVKPKLYLNYSAKPNPQDLTAFDLCILDPNAEVDLRPGHSVGHTFLAYISTVEVRPGSPMEKLVKKRRLATLGENPIWNTRLLDITDSEWAPTIVNDLATQAREKGFDGFFLDTLDSAELLTKQSPDKAAAHRAALIGMIKQLRAKHPAAKIVLNRGFSLIEDVAKQIDGVLVESVFQTFDPKTLRYQPVAADGTTWLERRIRSVQMLKLPVYAVDYVQPDQKELAKQTAEKLSRLGCIPFVTTHELNGAALAPLSEVPRRILVLFGHDAEYADLPPLRPGETLVARHLQRPLEWLGYQPEFLDVGQHDLPDPLPARFAGVMLDGSLMLRVDREKQTERWLERQTERGTPMLFAGRIPFTEEEAKARFARSFGVKGSLSAVAASGKCSIAKLDGGVMTTDATVAQRIATLQDLSAPDAAEVFLSLRSADEKGRATQFDPVFLAKWGGALLEPCVAFRAAKDTQSLYVDAHRFLGRWLRAAGPFPVPDATTRDGLRLFSSHVTGDGLTVPSSFPGHPTCAEVMKSEILSKYALPATISIAKPVSFSAAIKQTTLADRRSANVTRSVLASPVVQRAEKIEGTVTQPPLTNMVERFELSGAPLRTSAVNLRYDLGAAVDPATLRDLAKVYDWCTSQPLHPVTAVDQALISRDALATRFFAVAPSHWIITNTGSLRTLRIAASAGVPDLERSRGIAGYKTEGDITYIHTTGRVQTELVLVDERAASAHLRLVESNADVTFHDFSTSKATFTVGGWNTVTVVFTGFTPGAMIEVKKNKEQGRLQADANGTLTLSLPPRSTISLNAIPTSYAAAR